METIEITTETKWTPSPDLGPRQAKQFNEALQHFGWIAKTYTEVTDFGSHDCTLMIGGSWQPDAAPALLEIKRKYEAAITPKNYKAVIADIQAATVKLKDTRVVVDKRTSPEEKAARNQAHAEREAKANAEAERLAKFTKKSYDLVETAKAIRQVLSVLWPDVKFSVTSERYSMGCAINVKWTDGPVERQVNGLLNYFQDEDFDGSDDSRHCRGAIEWRGFLFDFTGNHVRGSREESFDLIKEAAERFTEETGIAAPQIIGNGRYIEIANGGPCGFSFHTHQAEEYPNGIISHDDNSHHDAATIIRQIARHTATAVATRDITQDTVFEILTEKGTLDEAPYVPPISENVNHAKVSRNEDKGGIEIRFPGKPAQSVIDSLKSAGWRWSRFSSCWWAKFSDRQWAFAQQLAGTSGTQAPEGEDYGLKAMTDIDGRMGA